MIFNAKRSSIAFLLFSAIFAGCDSASTSSVSGTVMYKDKPVANVQVNFVPESGYPVSALTDGAGKYTIKGATTGKNKVTVMVVGENVGPRDPNESPRTPKKSGEPATKIPEKYSQPGTTPLSHDVTSKDSTFNIELVD